MASNQQNNQEIHGYFAEGLTEYSYSDVLYRELTKTLDLNRPPANLNSFCGHILNLKNDVDDENKAISCVKDTRKRRALELDMSSNGNDSDPSFDLELSLSSKSECFIESISSSMSASSGSNMFMKQNPYDIDLFGVDDSTFDAPSLICMGCKYCHIYVMVSEIAPTCPNCNGIDLLDLSWFNPAKKARKN